MASFNLFYAPKLKPREGGYINDPSDRGGETYAGISYVKNPQWVGWQKVFAYKKNNVLIKNERIKDPVLDYLVESFYKSEYWDKLKADAINNQSIAEILVDFYVNGGLVLKKIQSYLKINADGIIGKQTIEAINKANKKSLFDYIMQLRKSHYANIIKNDPTQKKFEKGWANRLGDFVFENKDSVSGAAVLLLVVGTFLIIK
jgi:lysozyme family protein